MRRVAASLALLSVSTAAYAQDSGRPVAFIACPVVRDTALPCWLSSDGRKLYFLGVQQDLAAEFYPPQLKHRVLVEGYDMGGPDICGGTPLRDIRVSVMPEVSPECDEIIPAQGFQAPPALRGAGPSERHGPPAPRDPPPAPPFVEKTYSVPYPFDSERLRNRTINQLRDAAAYAIASRSPRLTVTGYRAGVRLESGVLAELEDIASLRAEKVRDVLIALGVAPEAITVRTADVSHTATGEQDWRQRRVDIRIEMP
ncbi:hypothetical protein [Sphingomonas soli]|uniref:hypothetical protein n=1 Tax=Sphingomonas soli TaxID=266127 RepID=UPI00082BB682|nr:hypothetical protein [Sphingomonas soli]